jgi:hypothetical protein
MTPTLFLHTGFHKTGTTTIQRTLYKNKRALAQQGFLYPNTGLTGSAAAWGQHKLAYALRRQATGSALWQTLRDEADAAKLPNVIVSSEELSTLPFATFPALGPYRMIANIFAGYDIVILCYLRPQADMAASLYNHQVKSVGETRDIIDFMAQAAPRLDYMQYLHVASSALGLPAIKVRRYGRAWLRGDIVEDFAHAVGLDLSRGIIRPDIELNPGLTKTGLAAMIDANIRLAKTPKKLQTERLRLIKKHSAGRFESCDMLGVESRRTIQALYRYKNAQIGRRFLQLDGDLFDPDVQPIVRASAQTPVQETLK